MRKRIANGVELLLLLVSFVMLWLPLLQIQYVPLHREMPLEANVIGLAEKGFAYGIFGLYGITALMCLVSILAKPENRDGKMHVIMPVLLFLYCASGLHAEVGTVVGDWEIVASSFPTMIYLGLFLAILAISIAKRSTLIAGNPTVSAAPAAATKADELKKYKELLDTGAITQEEFEAKKKELLN